MTQLLNAGRNQSIDNLKGLSILLVCVYHFSKNFGSDFLEFSQSISTFRMPVFFVISGFLFSFVNKNFRGYTVKLCKGLLLPYISFSVIAIISVFFLDDFDSATWQWKGFIWGEGSSISQTWAPMWFLPHLFLVKISLFCILKISFFEKNIPFVIIVFIAAQTIFLTLFSEYKFFGIWGFPYSLDVILFSLSCSLFGYYYCKHREYFKTFDFYLSALGVFVFLMIGFPKMDLNMGMIGSVYQAYLASMISIMFLFRVFELGALKVILSVFSIFGRNSLFILCLHVPIMKIMITYIGGNAFENILIIAFSVLIPIAIRVFILKLGLGFLFGMNNYPARRAAVSQAT
ncbi:MAG: hypothetical protein EP335_15495 [Alphaproteobacteria bacterium]|nr:MAG: hypothetical protein EP335_15495 [Alphaproteobacteria bacterium]